MKKIILAFLCLISISAFSQEIIVDVTLDGKPAKLNITTGVYTFTNGAPSNYASNANTNVQSSVFDGTVHTVSKGETLYAISNKYGISIAQIKSLNNLSTNEISINQQLKIGYNTSSQIAYNTLYIIEKGDTLYRIAKDANLSIQELKQLNNLENNSISIGQELKLK